MIIAGHVPTARLRTILPPKLAECDVFPAVGPAKEGDCRWKYKVSANGSLLCLPAAILIAYAFGGCGKLQRRHTPIL